MIDHKIEIKNENNLSELIGFGRRPSICILSFSLINRDGRVLRQIKHLAPYYLLNIVGYGKPHEINKSSENIKWYSLDSLEVLPFRFSSAIKKNGGRGVKLKYEFILKKINRVMNGFILLFGKVHPWFYEVWYWNKSPYRQAFRYLINSNCDAILANDWESLPVAVEASKYLKSKIIFDAHEYAPLQFENKLLWKIFFRKPIVYFIKKYSPFIDGAFTVSPAISERYHQEFGFKPDLVLNAPENVSIPIRPVDFEDVKLVHHGAAIRGRKLENLIETLAFTHPRFHLHFILIDKDPGYLDKLKKISKKLVPDRVFFEDPVPPEKIVERISVFDIGIYLLNPTTFNNRMALPNKFFDNIVAGLAVCIGPSPAMAEFVNKYGFGWVAPSFDPKDMAETLNKITEEDLVRKRLASFKASKEINASKEMNKVIQTFNKLLKSY